MKKKTNRRKKNTLLAFGKSLTETLLSIGVMILWYVLFAAFLESNAAYIQEMPVIFRLALIPGFIAVLYKIMCTRWT